MFFPVDHAEDQQQLEALAKMLGASPGDAGLEGFVIHHHHGGGPEHTHTVLSLVQKLLEADGGDKDQPNKSRYDSLDKHFPAGIVLPEVLVMELPISIPCTAEFPLMSPYPKVTAPPPEVS